MIADGAQYEPGERAVPPGAHNENVREPASVHQGRFGGGMDGMAGHVGSPLGA